jgi:hypothetical protein
MPHSADDDNLIKILGLEDLPDERKVQVLEKVNQLVQQRLLIRVVDSLSEADLATFQKLLDGDDQSAVNDFLQTHVPQMTEWLQEELVKVKEELGGLAAKTQ